MSCEIASRTGSDLAQRASDRLAETIRGVIFASAHGHAQVAYVRVSSGAAAKTAAGGARGDHGLIPPRSR